MKLSELTSGRGPNKLNKGKGPNGPLKIIMNHYIAMIRSQDTWLQNQSSRYNLVCDMVGDMVMFTVLTE